MSYCCNNFFIEKMKEITASAIHKLAKAQRERKKKPYLGRRRI
jgi:hypothetical protein